MTTTAKCTTPELHTADPSRWHYRTVELDGHKVRRYTCPACGKFLGYSAPPPKDLLKGKR